MFHEHGNLTGNSIEVILLDTHVLVRWVDPQAKPLPKPVIDRIETASARAVSTVSCWESELG